MATGQEIRMTDVPFSEAPDKDALVFINDRGKLRQTDLTTIAKYSELYTLILGAHEDAMSQISEQLESGQEDLGELLARSIDTLNNTKSSLEQALNNLYTERSTALGNQADNKLAELEALYVNSISALNKLIDEGHEKLLKDIETVDDMRSAVESFDIKHTTDYIIRGCKAGALELLELHGNTEQKKLSGKNLIDTSSFTTHTHSGVTYTRNSDGSITANGTKTERIASYVALGNYILKKGVTYTISGGIDDDWWVGLHNNNEWIISTRSYHIQTITPTEDINGLTLYIHSLASAPSPSNLVFKPQLEIGTVATEYEPYCGGVPSPNPYYPQPMYHTSDCVEMIQGQYSPTASGNYASADKTICNKHKIPCKSGDVVKITTERTNGFNAVFYNENTYVSYQAKSDATEYVFTIPSGVTHFNINIGNANGITPQTVGKITLTINGKYVNCIREHGKNLLDTSKNVNGVLTNDGSVYSQSGTYASDYIKVNGDVTLSLQSFTAETWLRICLYDIDKKFISRSLVQATNTVKSLTVNHSGLIRVSYETSAVDVQVEENSVATEYEPYQETVAYFLTEKPFMVDSHLFREDGLFKVEHGSAESIFDGSDDEAWALWNTPISPYVGFYIKPPFNAITSRATFLSDHFNSIVSVSNAENCYMNNGSLFFVIEESKLSARTVDAWKEWLSNNHVACKYKLATPIIEVLDTESQLALRGLKTFDGVTYIEADSRVKPLETTWAYGASQVSALTLKNANKADIMNLDIADLKKSVADGKELLATMNLDIADLKKSVADGKELLATTISGYRFSTVASDATFEEINTGFVNSMSEVYFKGGRDFCVCVEIPLMFLRNSTSEFIHVTLSEVLSKADSQAINDLISGNYVDFDILLCTWENYEYNRHFVIDTARGIYRGTDFDGSGIELNSTWDSLTEGIVISVAPQIAIELATFTIIARAKNYTERYQCSGEIEREWS